MLTAGGHDPDESPGISLRIMVFTTGDPTSGVSSLIEPSSAESRLVVFCTIQSRIGCSSALDATTSQSCVTNSSSAVRRARSGVPDGCGATVMQGSCDQGKRPRPEV